MHRVTVAVAMVAFVATGVNAQTRMAGSGRSSPPELRHTIAVPDQPGHAFFISQNKFRWEKPWVILGIPGVDGVDTSSTETIGDTSHFSGFYVETMQNGDKAFFSYKGTVTVKPGTAQTFEAQWTLVGGTGKLKGVRGQGSCKIRPEEGGGSYYECEGEYRAPE